MITESDIIYAAGAFDGEGTVYISKDGRSNGLYLCCGVANTVKSWVDWFQERWGGYVRTRSQSKSPNAKLCHDWRLFGPAAARFLQQIMPYLKIKYYRAWIALKFSEEINPPPHRQRRYTAQQHLRRHRFRAALMALNHRGL